MVLYRIFFIFFDANDCPKGFVECVADVVD